MTSQAILEQAATNLRPTQRTQRTELAERIMRRAEFLDPADRVLLGQIFQRGVSAVEVAQLTGRHPRAVQRRVRRLIERLNDPRNLTLLATHGRWDQPTARIALAFFIRGWPLRRIAADMHLSLHHVRQRVQFARGWIEAEHQSRL